MNFESAYAINMGVFLSYGSLSLLSKQKIYVQRISMISFFIDTLLMIDEILTEVFKVVIKQGLFFFVTPSLSPMIQFGSFIHCKWFMNAILSLLNVQSTFTGLSKIRSREETHRTMHQQQCYSGFYSFGKWTFVENSKLNNVEIRWCIRKYEKSKQIPSTPRSP